MSTCAPRISMRVSLSAFSALSDSLATLQGLFMHGMCRAARCPVTIIVRHVGANRAEGSRRQCGRDESDDRDLEVRSRRALAPPISDPAAQQGADEAAHDNN